MDSILSLVMLRMIILLFCVAVAWWALSGLKFERFVSAPGSRQAKLLHLLLAIVLGHQCSAFVFSYIGWSIP
ncbi:DUF1146 domain-containing protein [Paenibacillus sp.]|uniref:DUF1146 domain-containing protein n=1 Tax=Paenibacillus sp. TaxID=58172 RepID=UPI0028125CF5|nr:DUF1146 domain-containing protein [Paenibacillus sp.]